MPLLTYYSYDTTNPAYKYGLELMYNPVRNEIWTHFNFLSDNPTGDDLVRILNTPTIGNVAGQSVLTTGGFTREGFPDFYDSVTGAVIFRTSSGGEKILSVNATTGAVTPHSISNYFTWAYNTFASGALRAYGFLTSNTQIDTVNLATGIGTPAITTLPAGETGFTASLTFSSSTIGWMVGKDTIPDKLHKYNVTTNSILNSYTMPGAVTTALWVVYSSVNNSIYITTETSDNSAPRWIERFDIGSTTFTTVWTNANPLATRWFNSTDSAPILNYDSYRNLIWFCDGNNTGNNAIVAFDPSTDTVKYRFDNVFPADTQAPWKFAIAPDSIWINENQVAQFNQLLRISFPVSTEQPRVFVTLP
jgi:hypothetical protein